MTNSNQSDRNTVIIGILLLVSGLTLNYLFERHNVLAVWENSDYPVAWADLFYPPLCVFLSLTGIVLVVGGGIRRTTIRRLLRYAFAIVMPITVLYTLFSFAVQSIQTGSDRLGECPGLDQAASSSKVIPEAEWRPGHPAVACGVERRGIFLSYYNHVWVYGVTDAAMQQRVLDGIAEHFRRAHTHPVQVMFYEKENWSVREARNGASGSGGRGKLIRVVNIG
jgi:hypothetical protein